MTSVAFQSNLRKQIRKLPKILKSFCEITSEKLIKYNSILFIRVLSDTARPVLEVQAVEEKAAKVDAHFGTRGDEVPLLHSLEAPLVKSAEGFDAAAKARKAHFPEESELLRRRAVELFEARGAAPVRVDGLPERADVTLVERFDIEPFSYFSAK